MKLYILADKEGKPIVKKRWDIPLTKGTFKWDMYISERRKDIEDYIAMGGDTGNETVFELEAGIQ